MLDGIRSRLTYANVMATVAVFIALGGVSYAAVTLPKNSVGGAQIKRNAVTGSDVRNSSLTGADVKNASLTASDFKGGLPRGEKGEPGAAGPAGSPGPAGPAGTPNGYTRTEADARFLAPFGTTRFYSGLGFRSEDGTGLKQPLDNTTCVTPGSGGTFTDGLKTLWRELPLPDGARVTSVTFSYLDNLANNAQFRMRTAGDGGGVTTQAGPVSSQGTASAVRTLTLAPDLPFVVAAGQEVVVVGVQLDNDGTDDMQVCGVRLDYTFD